MTFDPKLGLPNMRFVFRVIAFAALSVAIILSIGDAIRSVAKGELVLTSLSASLQEFSPNMLAHVTEFQTDQQSQFLDQTVAYILQMPGALLFVGLFFLFYMMSFRRKKPRGL